MGKRKEAERKKNMYHWTDGEIINFMQARFPDTPNEYLFVSIYPLDRTEEHEYLSIDVRIDHPPEGLESGESYFSANLGFFRIYKDGRLYRDDVIEGLIPEDY